MVLFDKICRTRKSISRWKKHHPTNNAKIIESLKQQLDSAQNDENISSEEELKLKWKLCAAYREEEFVLEAKKSSLVVKGG